MARLRKSILLSSYERSETYVLEETAEKEWAGKRLHEVAEEFSFSKTYDIFLSHSYSDSRIIKQLYTMLQAKGYSVYVDWIVDQQLDRDSVDGTTARILRNRMKACKSLIYVSSASAEKSAWMPWELGFMDALTGLVSVAPILEEDEDEEFEGREYLGIYPYLDLTDDSFYIHSSTSDWVMFHDWLKGDKPGSLFG